MPLRTHVQAGHGRPAVPHRAIRAEPLSASTVAARMAPPCRTSRRMSAGSISFVRPAFGTAAISAAPSRHQTTAVHLLTLHRPGGSDSWTTARMLPRRRNGLTGQAHALNRSIELRSVMEFRNPTPAAPYRTECPYGLLEQCLKVEPLRSRIGSPFE